MIAKRDHVNSRNIRALSLSAFVSVVFVTGQSRQVAASNNDEYHRTGFEGLLYFGLYGTI